MLYLLNKIKTLKPIRSMLSVILSIAVFASSLGITTSLIANAQEVWDSSVATSLSGVGTESDPYLINNGSELAYAITSGGNGAYYKLTGNIYLNDITKVDWSTGEVTGGYDINSWYSSWEVKHQSGTSNSPFTGTIDGDGYTVYGLYFNDNAVSFTDSADWAVGLIPHAGSGEVSIKNLGIDNAFFHYEGQTAAFVGTGDAGATVTVEKCFAGEKVTLNGSRVAVFRAGAYGGSVDTSITDCYSIATLSANASDYGFVADVWGVISISNSYNACGPILSNPETWAVTVTNCYQTDDCDYDRAGATTITGDNMKGADALDNAEKMPTLNVNNAFTAQSGYPILTVFDRSDDSDDTVVIWDGETVTEPSDPDGDKVYEIGTPAEFAYVIKNGGGAGNTYKLTSDIYLNDISKVNWATGEVAEDYTVNKWFTSWSGLTAKFSGNIDGNGYTVYGMYYNENSTAYENYPPYSVALIPTVASASSVAVTNLGIDNAYVHSAQDAGALIGIVGVNHETGSTVSINKCYVGENVCIDGYNASAFRTYSYNGSTSVTNSYSLATLKANGGEHGIVGGWSTLVISNTYNANGPIMSLAETWDVSLATSYQTVDGGNNHGVVTVDADNMKGADVFTSSSKMPDLNGDNAFVAANGYPTLKVFDRSASDNEGDNDGAQDSNIWDGVTTTEPSDPDGDKVFEIGTPAEFAYVIKNGGGVGNTYKLTSDIYLNDISKVDWATGEVAEDYTVNKWFTSWSGINSKFNGNIDGNGHAVYGMYYNDSSTSYENYPPYSVALIPAVASASNISVTNLGIDNAYVHSAQDAGALIGIVGVNHETGSTVSINKCYVGENVCIDGYNASAFRTYSYSGSTSVTNSYSLATLKANGGEYGVVGGWSTLKISQTYNANGPIISLSETYDVSITNSYQSVEGGNNNGVVTVTADNMKGSDVFTDSAKMPNLNLENAFIAGDGYPTIDPADQPAGGDNDNTGDNDDDNDSGSDNDNGNDSSDDDGNNDTDSVIWNGSVTAPIDSDGDKVYEITKASEFAYVIKNGGENKRYKLTADIYLNDVSKVNWDTGEVADVYTVNSWYTSWNGLNAKFSGSINGNGHVVYGMYYNENSTAYENYPPYSVALIPAVASDSSASVTNLGIDNAYVHSAQDASALIGIVGVNGEAGSVVSVDSCYVGENVHIDGYNASAFRTYSYNGSTSVTNSYSLATIKSNGGLYGLIAGWSELNVFNCYNANGPVMSMDETYAVSVANCYQTVDSGSDLSGATTISVDGMKGTDVFDSGAKMPKLNADNVFVAQTGYPILYAFTDDYVEDGGDGAEDSGYWDGVTKTAPSKGKGTEADPYLITNAEELAYAVSSGGNGLHYKLTADIYLNDVSKVDWSTGKAAVGYRINKWLNYNNVFYGTIDGDGHVVYGLYYKSPLDDSEFKYGAYGMGLIPAAKAGESTVIKKLGIESSFIKFEHGASAFVGLGESKANITVDQCYAAESVTVIGHDAGAFRGCSGSCTTTLFNCYSLANVSAIGPANDKDIYWGLVGTIWGKLNIVSSYNGNGPILGHPERYEVTITDSYQSVKGGADDAGVKTLTAANMKGTDVFTNGNKMPELNKYGAYVVGKGYPTLSVFSGGKGAEPFNDEGVKGRVWSGKVATKYAGGTGTKDDPYLIETPEQLALLITGGSGDGDNYYKLTADIKLNDTSKADWEKNAKSWYAGMSIFRGTFDGNGHVVSGIYYYNENNEEASTVGLFQRLGHDSVIKRVGVVNSKIVNNNPNGGTFVGAIVGWLEDWEPQNYPERTAPIISECFADDTVYLEATDVGGILGGASTRVIIENCYFTGELTCVNFRGTFVGDHWIVGKYGPIIRNCYSASLDGDPIGGSVGFTQLYIDDGYTVIENVYNDGSAAGCSGLSVLYMRGDYALEKMKGFDFDNIWLACEDGTPVLRCFANAKQYSSNREPSQIEISFSTAGGSKCESIYGIAGYTKITDDMLPVPTRYGYVFKGWHHFNEYGTRFTMDVFPNFDIVLFAEWERVGFEVDFEDTLNKEYDYNSGIEPYAPGVENYDSSYIRGGWGSLHAKADSEIAPMFLLSYENVLEIGKEYEMTLWLATDQENAKGTIDFVFSNYADVNDVTVGYQKAFDYGDMTVGEWKEYKVTFTANAPYLLVRTPVGASLFFDDISVVPTGKDGELGSIISTEPSEIIDSASSAIYIIIACVAGVLVIGAVLTAFLVLRRKKRSA